MVKPEWGTKRACPKCNTRFYDLGKDEPVTCIECGNTWAPEAYLKSKQPLPFEAAKPKPEGEEPVAGDDDLDIEAEDEDEAAPADSAEELGDDDELGGVVPGEDDDES